jgi:hypothetical protein
VEARWKVKSINADGSANTTSPGAPFRAAVARDLFKALPEDEQDKIRARAAEEARQAKAEYEAGMKAGPLKTPEARQLCVFLTDSSYRLQMLIFWSFLVCCRCIDNFGRFTAPIMKGIAEYTGLKGLIIFGGPMPRYGGDIGTVQYV